MPVTDFALFLDFDGTLVDIVERPDAVTVDPGLPEVLTRLQERLGGALAIISGRPIAFLDGRLKPHRFDVAGLHGLEQRIAGQISMCDPDEHPALREVMAALAPHAGNAHVIGITGSPGVGKSTSTNALVAAYRQRGKRIGILAVDPSSPFSGGALLGDRVRMQDHALDPEVYIRSMASRGHLGGLSRATPQALRVLDGAGCDLVLVETVGVGQSEVEVAAAADTTVVLLAPGMGDSVQAAKAGILEIGDVFVVNKADREGADASVRELRHMLTLGERRRPGDWRPEVLRAVASRGEGVEDLLAALDKHSAWLEEGGARKERRVRRAAREVEALALESLRARMADPAGARPLGELAETVAAGTLDPYAAADLLLEDLAGVP